MAKKIFLKQVFLDLEEEGELISQKRQRALIRYSLHVIKEALVPGQAHITYDIVPNDNGTLAIPSHCFHILGVYPVSKEDYVKDYISKAKGVAQIALEQDAYSGDMWSSYDNLNADNGLKFHETPFSIKTMSSDEDLIVLYASVESIDNEIMIEEDLSEPIVAYIKWKEASKIMGEKFRTPRMTRGGDMNFVNGLKIEYGRLLAKYIGEKRNVELENSKRNQ